MPSDGSLERRREEAALFEEFLYVVLAEVEVRLVVTGGTGGWRGEGDDVGQGFKF